MTERMLHTLGDRPAERSDAARNRQLLLDAAATLVAESGPDCVTMDAVAAKAGVGKGTVFRRFGSRSGLMRALLDHSERQLQHDFMFGPPPLGPGADPVQRLIAYGAARLAFIELVGEVMLAADAEPTARFSHPSYLVSHTHVTMLLRQAEVPGDTGMLADALLATIGADLVMHQLRLRGRTVADLAALWEQLVRRVTA